MKMGADFSSVLQCHSGGEDLVISRVLTHPGVSSHIHKHGKLPKLCK